VNEEHNRYFNICAVAKVFLGLDVLQCLIYSIAFLRWFFVDDIFCNSQ